MNETTTDADASSNAEVSNQVPIKKSSHATHDNLLFGMDASGMRALSKTRPEEFIPKIEKGPSTMPGEAFVPDMERIGDKRVSDMIAGGGYIKPNLAAIVPHYLKGLKLKDELGKALGLKDRQGYADCALGYGLNSHYYTDEFGLSMTENKPFPQYIVDAAFKYLLTQTQDARNSLIRDGQYDAVNLDEYDKVKSSYPRGKNSGLPWIVPGKDRFQNDLVMASNALFAQLLLNGTTTDELYRDLLNSYVVFSRYQRTAKPVPIMLERPSMSYLFEPRRRVINAPPKAMSMVVKPLVKWLTVTGLRTDVFTQDRSIIAARSAAGVTFASDASRFDLRSGGVKLKQGLELLWKLATSFHKVPERVKDLMMEESTLSYLMVYGYPEPNLFLSDAESLRSGASTTSRVGCAINLMYDMYVESKIMETTDSDEIADFYRKYAPSIILGDDLLKTYGKVSNGAERKAQYIKNLHYLKDLGMEAELEEPTKFIGYNIDEQAAPRDLLLHSTSPLDNMFFPEYFKASPTASFVMRYIILKNPKANDALGVMTDVMRNPGALKKVYGDFHRDCYKHLAQHYADHPQGGARQFFGLLPKSDAEAAIITRSLMADIDEILIFLSKGSAYDFNYSLIGLPELNDMMDERDDVITATTNELVDIGRSLIDSYNVTKSVSGSSSWSDTVRNPSSTTNYQKVQKIGEVIKLFTFNNPSDIINHYHAMLPRIARRVMTSAGDVFVGNL